MQLSRYPGSREAPEPQNTTCYNSALFLPERPRRMKHSVSRFISIRPNLQSQ
jgi:hypothetical protein